MLPLARLIKRGANKKPTTLYFVWRVAPGAKTTTNLTKQIVLLLVQHSPKPKPRRMPFFGRRSIILKTFSAKKLIAQFFSTQNWKQTTWSLDGYLRTQMTTIQSSPATPTSISCSPQTSINTTVLQTSFTHWMASWTKKENQ